MEFAIGLPILLFVMLGTLDLGQMFFSYIELRNAVREGASYGAHYPTDNAGITARVTNHGDSLSAAAVAINRSGAYDTVGADATITVTGTLDYEPITLSLLVRFGIPGSFDLVSSSKAKVLT